MSQIDSQINRESISALLDNEADDLELRRFLKACEQDPSLLATWERFSLVQSVLHEPAQPVSSGLSQRIAAQLEQEAPVVAAPVAPEQFSWKDSLGKMAIAASVAAVFLLSFQFNLDSGSATPSASMLAEQSVDSTEAPAIQSLAASALLPEPNDNPAIAIDGGIVRQYIDSLTLDVKEPVVNEQIQDSPFYRLVNEMQVRP